MLCILCYILHCLVYLPLPSLQTLERYPVARSARNGIYGLSLLEYSHDQWLSHNHVCGVGCRGKPCWRKQLLQNVAQLSSTYQVQTLIARESFNASRN